MASVPCRSSDEAGTHAHLAVLDGLRGVAILLVLVFHFGPLYRPSGCPYRPAVMACWCGVDLFFVLSGFLITGILFDTRGSVGYFRTFYTRRVLRIFPLYYGALALLFVLWPLCNGSDGEYARLCDNQLWLWLYAQNFSIVASGDWLPCGANHFWSLAVEEQFYLFWPLVVFACGRRAVLWVSVALMVLALALRVGLTAGGVGAEALYVLTPTRLDGFGAGAVVAALLRGGLPRAALARGGWIVAAVCGLLLFGLWKWRHGLEAFDPAIQTLGFTVLAVFFAAVTLCSVTAAADTPLRRILSIWPLRWLAKYSYGIYVFHFPLGPCLLRLSEAAVFPAARQLGLEPYFRTIVFVTASAIAILLAVLSYHLYEKHFLKLKRFFPRPATVRAPSLPAPAAQRLAA
ncbi:MAG TPA: acyltransferase [Gemmataceae bacterium]|nr:acyltransferase [Gemmataceae bacterium]